MKKFFAKNYLIIATLVFVLSLISGALDTANNFEAAKKTFVQMSQFLSPIKGKSDLVIFLFIFLNNSLKALLAICLFWLFGIYSISMALTNGTMIGTAMVLFGHIVSVKWALAALLPHGIIEIPALLLTSAVALRLGHLFFKQVLLKQEQNLKAEIRRTFIFYLKVLLPMYLIAAIIETYLTPKIMELIK